MIKLIYDPMNGECMPDGVCAPMVLHLIDKHKLNGEVTQVFANELFFHTFRVQVKKGLIACEDVEVTFGEHKIAIDKDGRCHTWPQGFCDNMDTVLTELFRE